MILIYILRSDRYYGINEALLSSAFGNVKYVFIALPFDLLVTALFYFDHKVSSLTTQAKHYPLRKQAEFHWDFFYYDGQ
ncbi:unnamed protein product [Rotaria sp. Silwood2]|nr:unnamed protein product [Rotaria sp. Silwood2]CAF3207562.1 unnamed protein product [Rotaria sp. Silwood2]CAF3325768.1 unnamed protein product [Rotaria sp. Silwood2]CAF4196929.1 unnamed protein product [Rotaria sp. Silwood2]